MRIEIDCTLFASASMFAFSAFVSTYLPRIRSSRLYTSTHSLDYDYLLTLDRLFKVQNIFSKPILPSRHTKGEVYASFEVLA